MKPCYTDIDGKKYALDDPRFVGLGNPPALPNAPGMGTRPLKVSRVANDTKFEKKGAAFYGRDRDAERKAAMAAITDTEE